MLDSGRVPGWGSRGCGYGECCHTSAAWWVQCGEFEPPYVYSRCHSGAGDTIEWVLVVFMRLSFERTQKGGDPESEIASLRKAVTWYNT